MLSLLVSAKQQRVIRDDTARVLIRAPHTLAHHTNIHHYKSFLIYYQAGHTTTSQSRSDHVCASLKSAWTCVAA